MREEENKRHIAILGSTGSIGTQALEIIALHPELFVVEVLTANNNADLLIQQALQFKPNAVVIANNDLLSQVRGALLQAFGIHGLIYHSSYFNKST